MRSPTPLPWREPLDVAAALPADETHWVLLYSGRQFPHTGRYSLLARQPGCTVTGDDFAMLAAVLSTDAAPYANAWFGYAGYELAQSLERLPPTLPAPIPLPVLHFQQFAQVVVFDHAERCIHVHGTEALPGELPPQAVMSAPSVETLASPMSKAEYLAKAEAVLAAIGDGTLYQANLTRKFTGTLAQNVSPAALFRRLCDSAPVPYSALIRMGEVSILSASMERFLSIQATGEVETRPIKGSAPRHADPARDTAEREALENSAKNRAENLMIVDLMRNDLARTCTPGSIRVEKLFEATTYSTVHHLSSTVRGALQPGCTALDVVKNCWAPGSMTGAPKIRAMRMCAELEGIDRGVYSGAIGWFGGDGTADLSVVIRTLVLRGRQFEFQVGGGIVADSTPEDEWRETLTKASGLAKCLGIEMGELEAL